jgi:type II secretory pathway pseudopilin PulG
MTGRDRIVVMVIAVLAVVAGGWLLVVSPESKEAKKYEEQLATAQTTLTTARSQLADAKSAEAQYSSAYASVVRLGKAVPPSQEVASLVYQLEQVSNQRSVSFESIVTGAAGTASSTSTTTSTTSASAAAGFTQMPFTLGFTGGFFSLEHLLRGLTGFTTHTGDGGLTVSGRLLTIQSVKLLPEKAGSTRLSGTVAATAYVLPASQSLTGGATATSPGSATTTPAASSAASSTTAPAVARVTP